MDEDRLKTKSKFFLFLKIVFSGLFIVVGILYLLLSFKSKGINDVFYYTEFVFSVILIFFGILQVILSAISLALKKYNKPLIWLDFIQGLLYGILSTLIIITFFKRLIFVVKLLFGVFIITKILLRFIFFVRTTKLLFKKELSIGEMNKLRSNVLSYNVIKQIVLFILSLLIYVFMVVGIIQ